MAGCGAAAGAAHQDTAVHPSPAAHTQPPVMAAATPVLRPLEVAGAPPAPASAAGARAPSPVRLRIPAIGVDTGVVGLGLNPDGTIEVPGDPSQAGWYAKGPAPGEQGPAVMLGHLDSLTGPAVFYRLSSLHPGNEVVVSREDGSMLRFAVRRVASFPVDAFPTDQVYGASTEAELRLITCGGPFDLVQRRYQRNVVVFATLER